MEQAAGVVQFTVTAGPPPTGVSTRVYDVGGVPDAGGSMVTRPLVTLVSTALVIVAPVHTTGLFVPLRVEGWGSGGTNTSYKRRGSPPGAWLTTYLSCVGTGGVPGLPHVSAPPAEMDDQGPAPLSTRVTAVMVTVPPVPTWPFVLVPLQSKDAARNSVRSLWRSSVSSITPHRSRLTSTTAGRRHPWRRCACRRRTPRSTCR